MEDKQERKSISLRTINVIMVILAVVVVAVLLFLVFRVQKRYTYLHSSTEVYIKCESAAPDLSRGSDYLTEQVRSFAVTGDVQYCNQYFYEAKVSKRRDKAIETLEPYMTGTPALDYLNKAMDYSLELMNLEYYSMALVWDAKGLPAEGKPEEIRSVVLSAADAALSKEEKQQKAIQMVFDENYQSYKNEILSNADLCLSSLMSTMSYEQEDSYNAFSRILVVLFVMIIIMLFLILAIIFVTLGLVMRPMMKAAEYIKEQQTLPVTGASEVQFLANAYNDVFEQTQKRQEDLRRQALHDALTGLFNRAGYDMLLHKLQEDSFCLILIDVDKFKSINDQYGHDVGDLILKKTAEVLHNQFRAEDLLFRFGGDEFVVIMRNANEKLKGLICRKIENANRQLASDASLPAASFSAGAVFGSGTVTDDVFKQADIALYIMKNQGGCGISFSQE